MFLPNQLDTIFPYFVFFYGLIVIVALTNPLTAKLEDRLAIELKKQLEAHRWLAQLSLWIGAIWSLQNLWLA
jgi:hypothetical protein